MARYKADIPMIFSHKYHQAFYTVAGDKNSLEVHLIQLTDDAPRRGMFDMGDIVDYIKEDTTIMRFNDKISARSMVAAILCGLEYTYIPEVENDRSN